MPAPIVVGGGRAALLKIAKVVVPIALLAVIAKLAGPVLALAAAGIAIMVALIYRSRGSIRRIGRPAWLHLPTTRRGWLVVIVITLAIAVVAAALIFGLPSLPKIGGGPTETPSSTPTTTTGAAQPTATPTPTPTTTVTATPPAYAEYENGSRAWVEQYGNTTFAVNARPDGRAHVSGKAAEDKAVVDFYACTGEKEVCDALRASFLSEENQKRNNELLNRLLEKKNATTK